MRSVTRPVRLILLTLIVQFLAGCACGDCTDDDGDGFTTCDGDCNDSNPSVYPGALEICNGLDDDCSGLADQSFDQDNDGHLEMASCPGVVGADDCDDSNPLVYGGAAELCDDVDHNCDGDPYAGATGASDFCPDTDEDGYPNGAPVSNCGGDGWADCALDTDCDDAAPGINPGVTEACDGVDEDCDGTIDNGFDLDQDGVTSCGADGSSPSADDDCDDDPATGSNNFPGNTEDCDGLDNDCDSTADNGFDGDGDNFTTCGADGDPLTTADNDCNDGDNAIFPGATEACDSVDNDCNGLIDDNTGILEWYPDVDTDTFGDASATPISACTPPAGHVSNRDDCDDNDITVSPLGTEACDGIDNDCANGIDDGFDGDTDGAFDVSDAGCLATYGALADCDDGEITVFPGAPELCDGVDNDCDTVIPVTETDDDGDFYVECSPWVGLQTGIVGGDDCDDAESTANPNETEVCDGIDNDCINGIDDGQLDADGDGVAGCVDCDDTPPLCSDITQLTEADCTTAGAIWNLNGAANFPGNIEICDGIDNDCITTPTETTVDTDGDGIAPCDGDCNDLDPALNTDDLDGDGYSTCTGDCNEDSPLVNPGELEYCDTVDNDCDGDADPANALADGDGDGFDGTDCGGTDCDDSNSAVFPVFEYTSGMQRQCKPAVYPGFLHQWHQFEASNPAYFLDSNPANPTPHYLYFGGNRTADDRALGVVSSVDGVNWSEGSATPLFAESTTGWDAGKSINRASVVHVPTLFDGSVPARQYALAYDAGGDIGLATATSPEGPFERVDLNGNALSAPVLEHGTQAHEVDNKKITQPSLLRDSSGVLFMWFLGRALGAGATSGDGSTTASTCVDGPDLDTDPEWCPNAYTVLYATSLDAVTWQKFDTTASGTPDILLTTGPSGEWDDTKLTFPTVHRNSDPLNTSQAFEVWYSGRSAIAQGGVARGENSIAWEKHPLNPCIPAFAADPARMDGKDVQKLDRSFEADSDPVAAAQGAGVYHLYYHAIVNHSTSSLQGEIYGTAAGNNEADVHYVAYAINNAPRLAFTGVTSGAAISSPLDLAGTVTDNAPETVLLTLVIDGIDQGDVAVITPGDPGDFDVQTTDFSFSQIDLTQVVLDSAGTIGALSSGTHVFKIEVSDRGGAERSTSIDLVVP